MCAESNSRVSCPVWAVPCGLSRVGSPVWAVKAAHNPRTLALCDDGIDLLFNLRSTSSPSLASSQI